MKKKELVLTCRDCKTRQFLRQAYEAALPQVEELYARNVFADVQACKALASNHDEFAKKLALVSGNEGEANYLAGILQGECLECACDEAKE
ncbi:MAG: hypothetical protein JAY67_06930 [Candidatus Thiodiazotropha taylori]|nr:hypothetical protein [Candidatus Thiodiazotropha taylori]